MSDDRTVPTEAKSEAHLVELLSRSDDSRSVAATTLRTDQKVIARVTDGIYRQPASALRELLSNAYDADASRVIVWTDAPRFNSIVVDDDGNGMSPKTVAHLLYHIGGSAKRTDRGAEFGITATADPFRSPGGRHLIGKIGIGLFSVSQLTHKFQIVTKVKGDAFRTIATVALRTFDETTADVDQEKFESGKVHVWREPADDIDGHGTTVTLTEIKPQAKDTLRSRELWEQIEQNERDESPRPKIQPPKFHIGRADTTGELLLRSPDSIRFDALPWDKTDSPDEAFQKLVQSVWTEVSASNPNPSIERDFDYYLRMIWQLSLALPLPYIDGHPFDRRLADWADGFVLSNEPRGVAKRIQDEQRTLREQLSLTDQASSGNAFHVYVDNIRLSRPLRFSGLPTTSHRLRQPVVFIGKCRETFGKIPVELSGGPLSFEAYLFWSPKIAPSEHRGALIRIHGSSGTLFDSQFMRYQVAEQTRLRQITCEIFVSAGLDSALNIDRESFNHAHPHSVFITRWLHAALRQLATAHKRLAGEVRAVERDESRDALTTRLQSIALEFWHGESDDPASEPPAVVLARDRARTADVPGSYIFDRLQIEPAEEGRRTEASEVRKILLEEQLKAIVQVLSAYAFLDGLTRDEQHRLLRAIYAILGASEK